jgi:hypothetical protein
LNVHARRRIMCRRVRPGGEPAAIIELTKDGKLCEINPFAHLIHPT